MSKLLGDDNRFRMLLWIVVLGIYTSTLWNGKKIWWWKVYPCWVIEVEMEFLTTKRNIVLRSRDLLSVRIDRVWFERKKKYYSYFQKRKTRPFRNFFFEFNFVGGCWFKNYGLFFRNASTIFLVRSNSTMALTNSEIVTCCCCWPSVEEFIIKKISDQTNS